MKDNVVNFNLNKYFKDTNRRLEDYIQTLEDLSQNPRLAQGLVPALTAAITGLKAFSSHGRQWAPALVANIKTGPEDHLEALVLNFNSDVAVEGGEGKAFMTLSVDLDDDWTASIEKTFAGVKPAVPEEIIKAVNQFYEIDGEAVINNFAFIEFGIAATLRDLGFTQYVVVDNENKSVACCSRKGGVSIVQIIHNQVHHEDHLFLKNYGK